MKYCDPNDGERDLSVSRDSDQGQVETSEESDSNDEMNEEPSTSGLPGNAQEASSDDSDSDSDEEPPQEEKACTLAAAYKEKPKAPPALKIKGIPSDVQFRPGSSDVAVATLEGDVVLYAFSEDAVELKKTYEIHEKSTRRVVFFDSGTEFISVSKDGELAVVDVETGDVKNLISGIHEWGLPFCFCVIRDGAHALAGIDEYLCATGDAEGVFKCMMAMTENLFRLHPLVFDFRAEKCVMEHKGHGDHITALLVHPDKKMLISASGDGTISSFNVRAKRFEVESEQRQEELTSLALIRDNTKLVVGTNSELLYLFDWDRFGLHSDTCSTRSKSGLSSMVTVADKIVVVGDEDGILRAVHLFPHRVLGVVGQHEETVDRIDVSPDGKFLASTDFEVVRFWNIAYLENIPVTEKKYDNAGSATRNLPSSRLQHAASFFSGMDD
ncbi:unnamed protein product [Notodromas monacha]|uniref:WD repeat-containing protein 55 homolog n=1 Tax=Notodromas monacha TaxID=399045 RepID=A0A7R9BN91_9CRUS|nr:unnamed protein product [Notodromas monacha]CAG0918630.1 unnamed protein product [Notodromas monacha]